MTKDHIKWDYMISILGAFFYKVDRSDLTVNAKLMILGTERESKSSCRIGTEEDRQKRKKSLKNNTKRSNVL